MGDDTQNGLSTSATLETDRESGEDVGWPWRVFSAVAALLGAGVAANGAEIDNWISAVLFWIGYTVLVVVLYSYIVDIRR